MSGPGPGPGRRGVPGSLQELEDTHSEPLFLPTLARLLKTCFTESKLKPSFVSLWAPCLPQVSKKMYFSILNSFRENSANGSCRFQCPVRLPLSFHNTKTTQYCSANTNWVQLAEKEAEKLTLQLYLAPVPATAQVPGSRCCPSSSPDPVPSAIVDGADSTRRVILLDGTEQMDQGAFNWVLTLGFFLFCPCSLLLAVWGKSSLPYKLS